jgi:hypothetical protein
MVAHTDTREAKERKAENRDQDERDQRHPPAERL